MSKDDETMVSAPSTPTVQNNNKTTYTDNSIRLEIVEQPAPKAIRFRYECESRTAGSIPGATSTVEHKTYPTVRVVGYNGPVAVVVSCVGATGPPYKPHPHKLVGRVGNLDFTKGICKIKINNTREYHFTNLGIQCVRKADIDKSLTEREAIRIDPYKTGFSHKMQPNLIDLSSIRLCFQGFVLNEKGSIQSAIQPVVSDVIYDKKTVAELQICELSDCTSPATGGRKIILLCEKVVKDDIAVRFFEENNYGQTIWEAYGEFQPNRVHKKFAISFNTPAYKDMDITETVNVYMQLYRPSDGAVSDCLPFQYTVANIKRLNIESSMESESFPVLSDGIQASSPPRRKSRQSSVQSQIEFIQTVFADSPIKQSPPPTPNDFVLPPLYYDTQQSYTIQGPSTHFDQFHTANTIHNLTPQILNEVPIPNPNDSLTSLYNIDSTDLPRFTSSEIRTLERTLMESLPNNGHQEQQYYVIHQEFVEVDEENLSASLDKMMMSE